MFEVSMEETFAAGHALRNYQGKCENVHGHNYRCQVTLDGAELDATGLLVDFVELKKLVHDGARPLDHQWLNDFPPFDVLNPSAENMAQIHLRPDCAEALDETTPVKLGRCESGRPTPAARLYRP